METRSVSRCVAIAAHGKRCQQSPFRGSPYCWHHTQSRKIWAPEPPARLGRRRTAPRRPPSARRPRSGAWAWTVAWPRTAGRAGAARDAAAHRLAEALGPERVEELLDFLEGPADGAYLLVRDADGLASERSLAERAERRRRSASG